MRDEQNYWGLYHYGAHAGSVDGVVLAVCRGLLLISCAAVGHVCEQEESQVTLNTVENVEKLLSDVTLGSGSSASPQQIAADSNALFGCVVVRLEWDLVLEVIATLRLKNEVLYELFEQVMCGVPYRCALALAPAHGCSLVDATHGNGTCSC